MIDRILRTEPVRLYAILTAAVALAAYFLPSGAWPLVAALGAAALGIGAAPGPVGLIRNSVFSQATHKEQLDHLMVITGALPDPDPIPSAGSPDAGAVNWVAIALVVIAAVLVAWALGWVPIEVNT